MSNQPTLFELPKKQRAKPRKLMHVCEALGPDAVEEDMAHVRLSCKTCGHETEVVVMNISKSLRGIPCPKCNRESK